MARALDEWLAGGTRSTVLGHTIFHRQDGPADGPPVTLMHGFPTSSYDWAGIVPRLVEAGYRVTTFDFLGLGASAKPRGYDYRLTEQADITEELWRRLDIDRTALVAHDYGVSVAQELLARDADRIVAMTWLNGGLYPDLHRPVLMQRLLHGRLGPLLGRLGSERSFRAVMGQIMGRAVGDEELSAMWATITLDDGKLVQHRLLRYIDERRIHARRWQDALETYPGPCQFIWGPADPISGAHVLARLRDRVPGAEFTVLDTPPAVGHYPQVEAPDEVGAALVAFLLGAQ
ncbi:alpha/beta hydrolase [Nocardia sp. NPDC051833]|uniref:alpha/beta fold hydrolase n=1 Tax=Nocardia sp. NPDC051833 TaxID=3155674 RepID=UPI0034292DA9